MKANNTQRYDWFRERPSNKDGFDWKAGLKTTWKFTRIFLFFSVFFFSMWGCVQSFTNKTQQKIGQGVEMYDSQENISPQVTSIYFVKDKVKNIYSFKIQDDNVWFNSRKNSGGFQKEQFRSTINRFKKITNTTLDNPGKSTYKLSHSVARIVYNDKEMPVFGVDKKISLGSSLFVSKKMKGVEEEKLLRETKTQTINSIDKLALYEFKKEAKSKKEEKSKKEVIKNNLFETKLKPNLKKAVNLVDNWNQIYNLNLFNHLISLSDFKNLSDPKNLTELTETKKSIALNGNNTFVQSLISVVGKPINLKNNEKWYESKTWELKRNYFGQNPKDYKPIATWSQAWEMGRGSGPFYGIFVYPISWLINKTINTLPLMKGWESLITIVVIVVLISSFLFLLTFKATLQQTKMQEMNAKKAIIETKYEPYKGNKQMEQRKKQEIADLYKKEGISPLSSIAMMFVQMPFFLAMWRTIGTMQHIKGTTWASINFAVTSYQELFAGQWQYLPLLIVAGGTNILSQIYPRLLTKRRDSSRTNIHQKQAMKKNNKTQNIIMAVFTIFTLAFSAGLQIYFIVRSLWRVLETTITHHIIVKRKKNRINKKIKI